MQRLYFIRHGLSVNNKMGKLSGISDSPLSKEGQLQARQAGQEIKILNIDTIVSSSLARCVDTAKIIAQAIDYPEASIIVSELFIERDDGPFVGADYKTVVVREVGGVETVNHLINRATRAIKFLNQLEAAQNVLVVSHGAFGRALRHLTLDYDYDNLEKFQNAKVVRLI